MDYYKSLVQRCPRYRIAGSVLEGEVMEQMNDDSGEEMIVDA